MLESSRRVEEVSQLLHEHQAGDESALARVLPLVYDELLSLARAAFARQGPGHTLQPTAIVHEAWMRLVASAGAYETRHHFLAVASKAMRQILTNHARDQRRLKRGGGGRAVTLVDFTAPASTTEFDLVALDDSLSKLSELNERHARIVELRFFGQLTIEESADVLGVSPRTVRGDWTVARAWLQRELRAN